MRRICRLWRWWIQQHMKTGARSLLRLSEMRSKTCSPACSAHLRNARRPSSRAATRLRLDRTSWPRPPRRTTWASSFALALRRRRPGHKGEAWGVAPRARRRSRARGAADVPAATDERPPPGGGPKRGRPSGALGPPRQKSPRASAPARASRSGRRRRRRSSSESKASSWAPGRQPSPLSAMAFSALARS